MGMFTAVECRPGTIVLHIETEDESLQLAATAFGDVEFIAYRSSSPAVANCGSVEPSLRVFATYRESEAAVRTTGIDGRAVAIEVLPDGYVPN